MRCPCWPTGHAATNDEGTGTAMSKTDDESVTPVGGWCAPSEALYELSRLPEIGISRSGSPYPATPPVPPTRSQRVRARRRLIRDRVHAVRYAVGRAWKHPNGYWEED